MDQQRRLSYMKAMGIPIWAARSSSAYDELAITAPANESTPETQSQPSSALNLIDTLNQPSEQKVSTPQKTVQKTPPSILQKPKVSHDNSAVAALEWDGLQQAVAQCQHCEMHRIRSNTVFGTGSHSASWMIIGEAPDVQEDSQGQVFLGKAGQLLTNILAAVELKREDVYLSNILKCRPPNDRDPKTEEVADCMAYLQRQITLVQPKVIVVVGRMAAMYLLQIKEPLNKMRGKIHHPSHINTPVVVTYHPRYLLRQPSAKRRTWEDIKLALSVVQA